MGTLQRQTTLSKQTSAVFNLTLDQLQQSMGSGKPFGSMNMVRPCACDGPCIWRPGLQLGLETMLQPGKDVI
jgi:hypothetical protein